MSDYNIIKIGIIDLNINNLYSIYNAFKKIGYKTRIIKNNKNLDNQDFIVLPGVGAFKEGMNALKKNNLIDALKEKRIPAKICGSILTKIENDTTILTNSAEILFLLKNNISNNLLQKHYSQHKQEQNHNIEVILSCYFIYN